MIHEQQRSAECSLIDAIGLFTAGCLDKCADKLAASLQSCRSFAPSVMFLEKVLVIMFPKCQEREDLRPSSYCCLKSFQIRQPIVDAGTLFFNTTFPLCTSEPGSVTVHALWEKFFLFNDKVALNLFRKVSKTSKWYPVALHQLALYFYYGCPRAGIVTDLSEALRLFKQASNLGNTNSSFSLAFCYDNGDGTPVDHAKALSLYHSAADLGNTVAMYNLSLSYTEGNAAIPRNLSKAFELAQKAANYGDVGSMMCMYFDYRYGSPHAGRDRHKADTLLKKAAQLGSLNAWMEIGGREVKINFFRYIQCLHNAAEIGALDSAEALSKIYLAGVENGKELDHSICDNASGIDIPEDVEDDDGINAQSVSTYTSTQTTPLDDLFSNLSLNSNSTTTPNSADSTTATTSINTNTNTTNCSRESTQTQIATAAPTPPADPQNTTRWTIRRDLRTALKYASMACDIARVGVLALASGGEEKISKAEEAVQRCARHLGVVQQHILWEGQAVALLMGHHPRAGAGSPLVTLPTWILCEVGRYLVHQVQDSP